jgi:hypothetical protein
VSDQPIFEAEYVERRSRLTTFFRAILAIPHFIVLYVWGIVAFFAVVVAWFALLITGRYPQALYDVVAGLMRYSTAVYGYIALLTDAYPPFSADTDRYPVHVRVPPPKPEYDRVKVLFRIILAIPVLLILYAMQIVWEIGAFIAWFAILIIGKQPKGLQDMIVLGLSYHQRAFAYLTLLTESWPPFLDQEGGTVGSGGDPSSLPPAPATSAPPTGPEAPTGRSELSGGDPLNG